MNIKQEVLSDYDFRLSLSNIVAIYDGDGSWVCVTCYRHIFSSIANHLILRYHVEVCPSVVLTTTTTRNSKKCN